MEVVGNQKLPQILVASADAQRAQVAKAALVTLGCQVVVARDDKESLQQALVLVPDLILIDLLSPPIRGLVLCRHLKAQGRTALIPLVGMCEVDQRDCLFKAGADDCLVVPLLVEEVRRRVGLHLGMQSHLALAAGEPSPVSTPAVVTGSRAMLVSAARLFVSQSAGSVPSGEEVAQALDVSTRRLSRAFQQEKDMTLFAYLRDERMRRAQDLLANTALGITAIAREVGFTSAANFSTAFLSHCGMTPSTYRAQADVKARRRTSGS